MPVDPEDYLMSKLMDMDQQPMETAVHDLSDTQLVGLLHVEDDQTWGMSDIMLAVKDEIVLRFATRIEDAR